MNHIYALGFAMMFITGGISLSHQEVKSVKDQSRLDSTVYVPWPEKYQDRLEKTCHG